MPQHLPDLRQRRPGAQHVGGQRVSQPMRTHPRQARAATPLSHDAADRRRREPPIWLAHRSEHRPRLAVGPAIGQICHDRFPDIAGHREPIDPVALAPHRDLTGTPIQVAEPQVGGLGAAQSQPHQHDQDRVVTPTDHRGLVAGPQ